ncbi:MAG: hypothetical protein ABIK53_06505 [bacterium]
MKYKENWPEARERWIAYWNGDIIDRPIILMMVPKKEIHQVPEPKDPFTKWTDIDYEIKRKEAIHHSRYYLGEAIPHTRHGMAWSAYYGGPVKYQPDSIWLEPCIESWDKTPDWKKDWNDWGWKHLKKAVRETAKTAAGKYSVGLPPLLHACPNDMLSMMRGPSRFLMDLIEYPEEVKHALKMMRQNYPPMYDELYTIIHSYGFEGYGNWWPVWSKERLGIWQSDVSAMISPEMYEEFIVPEIEELSSTVKYSFYHLDGPDAIKHVDRICDVSGIHTIQWMPGAGQKPGALQWMNLFKRIQAKNKGILIYMGVNDLETIIKELNPRKLILWMGAKTVTEAKEIFKKAAFWTAKYWGKR